jgi:hypothetical protein
MLQRQCAPGNLQSPQRSAHEGFAAEGVAQEDGREGRPAEEAHQASFDQTLDATRGGKEPISGTEAEEIFQTMKKREF